jgi:hypothetical protein
MKTRFLMLVLLAAACGSNPVEQLGTGVVRGVIKFQGQVVINVPETAEVGEPVTISVRSWGVEDCYITRGPTRVTDSGHWVLVEPFDTASQLPRAGVCGGPIYHFAHEATVVFSEQGMVFVEFRGREWPENKPYSTRRRILVR